MEFLIFISIFSPAICGLYLASQEGMILWRVKVLLMKLPDLLNMPLITCPTCMASVWGFTSYWFYFGQIDLIVIPCIFALAFTNSLLIELYELIRTS